MCGHCKGQLAAYVDDTMICLDCGCSFEADGTLLNQPTDCDGQPQGKRTRKAPVGSAEPPADSTTEVPAIE